VIVVLGMHRSGTSVLARGLQVLGVELGHNLMPALPANPKGYWEDREINHLNERILAALARNWRSPGLIDDSVWNSSALEPLVSEAKQLLDSRFGKFELWGFKDPRTCLLLPFWQLVFRELGLEARYVISLRNPLSVAGSLRARDAMVEELSLLLWLQHLRAAFKYTENQPRLVVDYDELLKAPRIQICRIAKALELPAPISTDAALQSYADEFLAVDLRHHEFSAEHSPSDSPLKRLAVSTYELLRQVSIGEIDCDRASLGEKLDLIDRTLEAITPFSSMVAELARTNEQLNSDNQQLNSDNQQLNSDKQQLNSDNQQFNSDNQQLNSDNQQLNSTNRQLNSDNRQLNSDNQQLDSANQQLNSVNQQLNSDNQQLNSANQQLNSANQQLNSDKQQLNSDKQSLEGQRRDLEAELKEIKDSDAWRIVFRYREGLDRARVLHPRVTRFYESIAIRSLRRILGRRP
jgi:hypothetical protein